MFHINLDIKLNQCLLIILSLKIKKLMGKENKIKYLILIKNTKLNNL